MWQKHVDYRQRSWPAEAKAKAITLTVTIAVIASEWQPVVTTAQASTQSLVGFLGVVCGGGSAPSVVPAQQRRGLPKQSSRPHWPGQFLTNGVCFQYSQSPSTLNTADSFVEKNSTIHSGFELVADHNYVVSFEHSCEFRS